MLLFSVFFSLGAVLSIINNFHDIFSLPFRVRIGFLFLTALFSFFAAIAVPAELEEKEFFVNFCVFMTTFWMVAAFLTLLKIWK